MLAHSDACERNKEPILAVLREALATMSTVLEVGSGTGQHAVHFAAHLPQLVWQPSEVPELLAPLAERIRREGGANLRAPVALDVRSAAWTCAPVDAVFSANTLHIMSWDSVGSFFRGAGAVLAHAGVLCVYGPFNYGGRYTSDSNAQFDAWLQERDPVSGLRDFAAVDELARAEGLKLAADHAMPANNRILLWRRAA
jgi:cyclopropane fatty-acyl-phospholipid synthase-like methyltransferase